MSVERNTPTTSGTLTLKAEPGVRLTPYSDASTFSGTSIQVTGALGVRFLSQLIEEATALRDDLRVVVG